MRRLTLIGMVLLLIGVYFYTTHHAPDRVTAGHPVPGFSLPQRDGGIVHLEAYRGKAVLVNFWATWCYTCSVEMPALNRLAGRLAGRPFQIIGISEDGESGGGWETIDRYRARFPIEFLVLLDPDGRVADAYGTEAIPESYLIDPEGRLVRKVRGVVEWDSPEIVALIESLLR